MNLFSAGPRYRLSRPLAVTWRDEGVLQLGLDAGGVVLEGVPADLADAVRALEQPRTLLELAGLVPTVSTAWLRWLLHHLQREQLVWTGRPEPGLGVAVVGAGRLADRVADLLRSTGAADPERIASIPRRATGHLDPRTPLTPVLSWAQQQWRPLTVVATDTTEPDRALTDALVRAGRTHLVVRLEADLAVVGPLVIPGRSPCQRCQDLVRCRLDPAWPRLVAQLCRVRSEPDPLLLAWAAASCVAQVCAVLAGHEPDTGGRSLELGRDYTLRTRDWAVHPDCGCQRQAA